MDSICIFYDIYKRHMIEPYKFALLFIPANYANPNQSFMLYLNSDSNSFSFSFCNNIDHIHFVLFMLTITAFTLHNFDKPSPNKRINTINLFIIDWSKLLNHTKRIQRQVQSSSIYYLSKTKKKNRLTK